MCVCVCVFFFLHLCLQTVCMCVWGGFKRCRNAELLSKSASSRCQVLEVFSELRLVEESLHQSQALVFQGRID